MDKTTQILTRLNSLYESALPIAERLAVTFEPESGNQAEMAELESLLATAQHHHVELKAIMPADTATGQAPEPIRGLSRELAGHMSRMIELFAQIEGRVRSARERLVPEMDESARAQRMRNAYAPAQFRTGT